MFIINVEIYIYISCVYYVAFSPAFIEQCCVHLTHFVRNMFFAQQCHWQRLALINKNKIGVTFFSYLDFEIKPSSSK